MSNRMGFPLTCFSVFRQYQDFLEDLEEDEALRKNVNIYRGEQTFHCASVPREICPSAEMFVSIVKIQLIYCRWLLTLLIDLTSHGLLRMMYWIVYEQMLIVLISDASKIPVESDTDDDGAPRISLMEMLEELSLTDATGEDGADMMTD